MTPICNVGLRPSSESEVWSQHAPTLIDEFVKGKKWCLQLTFKRHLAIDEHPLQLHRPEIYTYKQIFQEIHVQTETVSVKHKQVQARDIQHRRAPAGLGNIFRGTG